MIRIARKRFAQIEGVLMRRLLAAAMMVGLALPAIAGDFETPVLRGSSPFIPATPKYPRWSGFYAGGQGGYSSASVNFSGGVQDLVANILRNTIVENEFQPSHWTNLPRAKEMGANFGAFFGYNAQFEDAIVGIEANYSRTNIRASSGDTIGRVVNTSDGYANAVTVSGTGSVHLTDFGTLRLRGGWATSGFMPYGFVGVAVGRATIARSASVSIVGTDADPACVGPPNICLPPYAFSQSQISANQGSFGYGWTAGAGIDVAVYSKVFVRAEYEFVAFPNFNGTNISLSSARGGIGVRF